jgi:hypothetical protein
VAIPAYEAMQENGLSERVLDVLMRGISTRPYSEVLPEMASTCGVSKSNVSREAAEASEEALNALLERRFNDVDRLVISIDGMMCGEHHGISAVGVDRTGWHFFSRSIHVLHMMPHEARLSSVLLVGGGREFGISSCPGMAVKARMHEMRCVDVVAGLLASRTRNEAEFVDHVLKLAEKSLLLCDSRAPTDVMDVTDLRQPCED